MTDDGQPFLATHLPAGFVRREVVVRPGASRPYDSGEWADALVVVQHGAIELECTRGSIRRFVAGDVLWLVDLPLRTLHNRGSEPAVLVAVTRRSSAPPSAS